MFTVLLVIHLLVASALVGIVLIQRSEGGALGSLGGGQGGGFMTGRGAANVLTRTTAILFAAFLVTSVLLSIVGNQQAQRKSILDQAPDSQPAAPVPAPSAPAKPAVPLPQ